ncbi:MAG: PIN domain-containing protein [Syntrophobacteraceae bacterium]
MRVLFDTNVVLDLMLDREPFSPDAARCFSRVESGEIDVSRRAETLNSFRSPQRIQPV